MPNMIFMSERDVAQFVGERLRQYRVTAGLRRSDLAERMGVSLSTVRNIEKGVSGTIDHFVSFLRATGRLAQLEQLLEPPQISPLAMARAMKPFPQRVRKRS